MDDLRRRYGFPSQDYGVEIGTSSAVLTQTFVVDSLRREKRTDDGLNALRGALNALLISLAFWVALGAVLFSLL